MSSQSKQDVTQNKENGQGVEVLDHDDFNVGKLMQELNGAESMLNSIEARAAELDAKLDDLLKEASNNTSSDKTASEQT